MIVGIGTDIIEIERINRSLQIEHFIKRVFTTREIEYCNSRGRQKAASYAARFAGKEAFFKALGTGIIFSLNCVEILNDELGQPHVNLKSTSNEIVKNLDMSKVHISLSHSKYYATATCIIEI